MGISENVLQNPPDVLDFMFGGQAEFTLHSKVTGKHYTYRVIHNRQDKDHPLKFVFFLGGSDNDNDWVYAGSLRRFDKSPHITVSFLLTNKSPPKNMPGIKAFGWMVHMLNKHTVAADQMEIMHSGVCSACGRKLTTPESIRTGLGPVCRSKL